ncbi:hypothetical protein EKO04_003121 [Ascochyta lentis]|uniref:Uncharacterized protein n=1 Tax=Ascochyta lentis TaxID=205686 RepID=A0A8H7JBM5_9PLEO|nr:hypothetical protein EKO04_003121 [Ascochyta lentis]
MEYEKDLAISSTSMPSNIHGKANEYVRHSEVPPESDVRLTPPGQRSFVEKIGLYNIVVLIIGAVAICLAMAFLALLWSGSESARHGLPTPALWFAIIQKPNWATRVVTVGSVLVRLATAAQMGILAALMAAWTLETTGASAEHLPLLSIIRTVNNGPQSHIWNVFHSLRTGAKRFYSAIIILAILDALALQFTSTLLVTDFGPAVIVPGALNQTVAYGLLSQYDSDLDGNSGKVQAWTGVDLNQAAPPTYPRFAEFTGKNSSHIGMDYVDTGEILRAFLPLGLPDTRAVLREFKGPATAVDSRVRCARPSMSITNVTFLVQSGTNEPYEIILLGNITMEGAVPGITVNVTESSGSFMATAMARIYANTSDWRLSYSLVNVGDLSTPTSPLDPSADGLVSFLLLNITGNDWASVLESINYETGVVGPYSWTQESSGVWSDLRTSNETIDIGISATVCFVSMASTDLWIHANSERDFAEPRNMSWVRKLWKYETGNVRRMLGATQEPLSLNDRGILDFKQPANWTESILNTTSQDFITASILDGLRKLENPDMKMYYPDYDESRVYPQTAVLTPYSPYNSINRAHTALFQDVIQTTENPALAFQAMFTTISSMAYYNALPLFFMDQNATVASSKSFTIPVQWTGFAVVVALLFVHAILVITAVVLFLCKTDHSLLGNAWQAVAQVSSSDTMDTMHHATNMTDLEVKRLLRMNNGEDDEVVLKTGVDSGRSQAVYRRGGRDN